MHSSPCHNAKCWIPPRTNEILRFPIRGKQTSHWGRGPSELEISTAGSIQAYRCKSSMACLGYGKNGLVSFSIFSSPWVAIDSQFLCNEKADWYLALGDFMPLLLWRWFWGKLLWITTVNSLSQKQLVGSHGAQVCCRERVQWWFSRHVRNGSVVIILLFYPHLSIKTIRQEFFIGTDLATEHNRRLLVF